MARRRNKRRERNVPPPPAARSLRRPPGSFWTRNGALLRAWSVFVAVFLGLMAVFLRWGGLIEHQATTWTARLTAWTLWLLGFEATTDRTLVISSLYTADIIFECTAVFPLMIFLAAVVAYPATLRAKAFGLAAGVPTILLFNQVRLLTLFFIGRYYPAAFETAHLVVWQSLMIFFTLALWLAWALRHGVRGEARAA